ncbi:MAG: tyrosine--tRNA ligase [Candidatus Colwellbacteria bacterium CG10_big_fil_rev_8_21_14_0_10_42_22]|uniref:Tyrosine--tRNA ligase n=1 Tax=Candidatus Colwellbacteria bacterium CG10_big_fil_rev_8_21_14_0_10_42_22 TaxID=1974540 RepID=A0A2H0VI26_9BACT|nr:MAG: tyrosine--tRNA ligase [Candidatus Colwellbacteria bacterium CG10_big_fil_rev_8_21_14_0_10_42_22]
MASLTRSSRPNKKAHIEKLLTRGVDQIIVRKHLEQVLVGSKKLRVKLGIDPTSPDLHLGHAVVLKKLRDFQQLGHKVVLIIGDFTARVGDPSGQSKERPILSEKEIKTNTKDYLSQVGKIIDVKKAEIRYNSEWLGKDVGETLELVKVATLNQVGERADFQERIKKGQKVSLLEALYPLLQGFDSVKVKADVELGGTDQLLNLLMGRQVQRYFGMKEQDILITPLIEGTDGSAKMSKSKGNYIGLKDSPEEMFGKIMAIPDALIYKYFELCTDANDSELRDIKKLLKSKKKNPMELKLRLGKEIVSLYHNQKMATDAEKKFIRVFSKKELPEKIDLKVLDKKIYEITELLVATGMAPSKSEARRLVIQGGVKVGGKKVLDTEKKIKLSTENTLLQVGKRRFLEVRIPKPLN